jgi:hypothetical protein
VSADAQVTAPAQWLFTSNVDPSVPRERPRAFDITLRYAGRALRAVLPLTRSVWRGGGHDAMVFFAVADGTAFGGLLSAPSRGRWANGHLDFGRASMVRDPTHEAPLDMASAAWLEIVPLPSADPAAPTNLPQGGTT